MTIDQFIEQYGPIEMVKCQNAKDLKEAKEKGIAPKKNSSPTRRTIATKVSKFRQTIKLGLQTGDAIDDMETEMKQYNSTPNDNSFISAEHGAKDKDYRVSSITGFAALKNMQQDMRQKSTTNAGYNTATNQLKPPTKASVLP
jgi:hypothetical protein